jgi:hypothetical protein
VGWPEKLNWRQAQVLVSWSLPPLAVRAASPPNDYDVMPNRISEACKVWVVPNLTHRCPRYTHTLHEVVFQIGGTALVHPRGRDQTVRALRLKQASRDEGQNSAKKEFAKRTQLRSRLSFSWQRTHSTKKGCCTDVTQIPTLKKS